jgi:hypothetical protein
LIGWPDPDVAFCSEGCQWSFPSASKLLKHSKTHLRRKAASADPESGPFSGSDSSCDDENDDENDDGNGDHDNEEAVLLDRIIRPDPSMIDTSSLRRGIKRGRMVMAEVCTVIGRPPGDPEDISANTDEDYNDDDIDDDIDDPACDASGNEEPIIVTGKRSSEKVKLFDCPHDGCDRSYTLRRNLAGHIRASHTAASSFVCDVPGCGQQFGFKYSLARHTKLIHQEQKVSQLNGRYGHVPQTIHSPPTAIAYFRMRTNGRQSLNGFVFFF